MQRGVGIMQLTAVGALDEARRGTHRLRFTNRHRPATSVYLANALLPVDRDIRVVAQRRDRLQHEPDVEYAIAPRWSLYLIWVPFAVVMVVSRIAAKRF